jgi:hypothetical protein
MKREREREYKTCKHAAGYVGIFHRGRHNGVHWCSLQLLWVGSLAVSWFPNVTLKQEESKTMPSSPQARSARSAQAPCQDPFLLSPGSFLAWSPSRLVKLGPLLCHQDSPTPSGPHWIPEFLPGQQKGWVKLYPLGWADHMPWPQGALFTPSPLLSREQMLRFVLEIKWILWTSPPPIQRESGGDA